MALDVLTGTARSIRPLDRDDLEQVADLYERVARSGASRAPAGLAAYFEETLFEHPWADRDIPSLVYARPDGRIVGFLASHVRRLTFDGAPIRAGCCGQLVTDVEGGSAVVGTLLMRAYMAGEQALTYTDTASATVQRLWEGLGGTTAAAQCVGWFRIFRPWGFARDYLTRRGRGRTLTLAAPIGKLADAALARTRTLRAPATALHAEKLRPALVARSTAELSESLRLAPAYDEEFVRVLFQQMERVTHHGELVRTLVRDVDGRSLGWYVYYRRPRGISSVLQIGGDEDSLGAVIDHLFADAALGGSVGVQGRAEPRLLGPLATRKTLLHASGYLSLVHASRPEILAALSSRQALLTRMEGEWWMGHHLLRFPEERS